MIRRMFALFALCLVSGCITTEQAVDAGKQIINDRVTASRQPAPQFVVAVTNAYAIDEGRWITGRVQAVTSEHRYYPPVGPGPVAPPPSPQPVPPPPAPLPPPVPVNNGAPFLGPITGSLVQ